MTAPGCGRVRCERRHAASRPPSLQPQLTKRLCAVRIRHRLVGEEARVAAKRLTSRHLAARIERRHRAVASGAIGCQSFHRGEEMHQQPRCVRIRSRGRRRSTFAAQSSALRWSPSAPARPWRSAARRGPDSRRNRLRRCLPQVAAPSTCPIPKYEARCRQASPRCRVDGSDDVVGCAERDRRARLDHQCAALPFRIGEILPRARTLRIGDALGVVEHCVGELHRRDCQPARKPRLSGSCL